MSSSVLEGLRLHPIRIPMRQRFRRVDHRDVVLVEGDRGWGEFSPFAEYGPEITRDWLRAAIELASEPLPEPIRDRVPVNATVPAVDPETAARLVADSGATTAKVKVGEPGQRPYEDVARVAAVRDALGSAGQVRVDANAAWDVATASRRLEELARFGLQYAEQPVAGLEEMIELRRRRIVPLAADELVRLSDDPLEVAERGATDFLIVKVQPMGGVRKVLQIAAASPVPVVVSSALESSVGMFGGVLAAAALPQLDLACGLGTVSLLAGDPTESPLVPEGGWMDVRRPVPDPELIERFTPDGAVSASMLRRVDAAAELLG